MTGASCSDSIARRTASRSSASSPRVELTKTRRRWSGVRIMQSQRSGGCHRALIVGYMERARLAELVGSLSLGIDLGFGQPMEQVVRDCLIALRLGGGMGLDEDQRAVVYYPALLVNVGCHTDAHEQAKWFGDDIATKSIKYDHDGRSLRMAAKGMSMIGAGHAPLHRFRLGLEFALSGHRET